MAMPQRWIDVTRPIRDAMEVFPGDPPVSVRPVSSLTAGDPYAVSLLSLGTHAGTHVDAPGHYLERGGGVESLDLEALVGPAVVAEVPAGTPAIDAAALDRLAVPPGCERLLLKTRAAGARGTTPLAAPFIALDESGARRAIDRGIRLLGVDTPSVGPLADPGPVHRLLLAAGVVVLESLELSGATPGEWTLVCLPLLVPGADGAPARAILGRPVVPGEPAPGHAPAR
ncbi:MAG: cyclase family protein [Chloroflexi bacterium]|nr:cyclase family protein [Chloroflexota bacterium]